jgi:hypothetical protein
MMRQTALGQSFEKSAQARTIGEVEGFRLQASTPRVVDDRGTSYFAIKAPRGQGWACSEFRCVLVLC